LKAERAKRGEGDLKVGSVREKVRQMFHSIGRSSACNARVVETREKSCAGGDGREKALCLFPKVLSDEVIVGCLLRARNSPGSSLESQLERVAQDPAKSPDPDIVEKRMAVVKTAGGIVRRDIQLDEGLKNAPGPGKPNIYMKELERPVEPTRKTLLAMPPTLVGLLQGVTDEELHAEKDPAEPRKEAGPGKVWECGWREKFGGSAGDDTAGGSSSDDGGTMRDGTVAGWVRWAQHREGARRARRLRRARKTLTTSIVNVGPCVGD